MENISILKKVLWGILFAILMVVLVLLFGQLVMLLWNFVVPDITGWKSISFQQALALLLLCKILFGSFGKGGGGGRSMGSKWKNKWNAMSDEEKELLKDRFKQSCRKD